MRTLTNTCLSLCLAIILIGCASKQVVTKVEVVKVTPPASLLEPREEPQAPPLPESMSTGELQAWWMEWVERWRAAFGASEADKQAVREWAQ